MDSLMVLLVVIVGLVAIAQLALRHAIDSRDSIGDDHARPMGC